MIYLFDIDGVLTDTGYNINEDFKKWFLEWAKDKRYALVTGSTFERTIEQIGEEITHGALLVANCMGNSIYQHGKTVVVNEFDFTEEQKQFLQDLIDNSPYPVRAGNHIVSRPGSYNVSVLGRNASTEQREEYKKYDSVHRERISIAEKIKETYPEFDVFVGGDISLDICMTGANKAQVFDLLCHQFQDNDRVIFFGDKMSKWGIDKPLKEVVQENRGKAYNITSGYDQTKNILMYNSEKQMEDEAEQEQIEREEATQRETYSS